MAGRLWGLLAVLCVCVLITVTGENTTTTATPPEQNTTTTVTPPAENTTTTVAPPGENTTTTATPPEQNTTTTATPPEQNTTTTVTPPGENTTTTATPPGENTTTTNTTTTFTPPAENTTTTVTPPGENTTTTATPPEQNTTTTATIPITTTTTVTTTITSPGVCMNGGTWEDGKCLCPEGFQGDRCEEPVCQNGGTWANGLCLCPLNFQGDRCQFVVDIVEIKNVTMNATVEMTTKVDNRNFTEELKNSSSPAYKSFEKEFQEKMKKIYGHIKGYQGVVIKSLSAGSIKVDYNVSLEVPANSKANETVKTISDSLVAAFQNYSDCNGNCTGDNCSFCFNTSFTSIHSFGVQEVEGRLCDAYIQEGFSSYYTPHLTDTGVICITRCDARSADPLPCVHGSCSVGRLGPQCECSDKVAFWYQDSACSSRISKVGVAVGVPMAVLVLVTTIFTVLLLRSRRQKEQYRNKLRSRAELYSSEDGNWEGSQGFSMGNLAATWEDMETPSTSYINLERVDTSKMMHIRRPTVVP
ncbi:mucin-3B-like [Corvus hawaiiensis]|uniref:mucin-3B-like n=1 Tax=Corvus hawaiiensis TaxID=134902 RepID=UPI002018ECC3|nr:mucin-3B-like [Corvus hawaiiensis]